LVGSRVLSETIRAAERVRNNRLLEKSNLQTLSIEEEKEMTFLMAIHKGIEIFIVLVGLGILFYLGNRP